MININLLPKKRKEDIKKRRFNLYLTSISTMVLFLIGIIIVLLFFIKISVNNQTKSLDRQIDEKNQQLSQYNQQKDLINNFNQTITIAKELISKDINWRDILNDLDNAVPDKLKLTEFSPGTTSAGTQTTTTTIDTSGNITIGGTAADQRSIIKFIEKLGQSKFFTNVALVSSKSAQAAATDKTSSYTFEISATLNTKGSQ